MKWHEIKITTKSEAVEAITEMLMSVGAGGTSVEDPNDILMEISKPSSLDYVDSEFLESLGKDAIIRAYFNEEKNISKIKNMINKKLNDISKFLDTGKKQVEYDEVDDEDWSNSWKKYYKPFKISEKIVIKPSWEDYKEEQGDVVIELDPGMAFGTGTHETTKMCAMLLEKYIKHANSVIDIGCGTGILSMIASKLGARSVLAIDIDELAVRIAKENAYKNGVKYGFDVRISELKDITGENFNIVVANIISNVIIDLADLVKCKLSSDGYFITSGIIKEKKDEVVKRYREIGFGVIEQIEMGEWVAMVFKCQDSL